MLTGNRNLNTTVAGAVGWVRQFGDGTIASFNHVVLLVLVVIRGAEIKASDRQHNLSCMQTELSTIVKV